MRNFSLIILLCALFALTYRQKEHIEYERVLKFGSELAPLIPQHIKQIDFLPLEFSEAARFYNIDKLVFKNDLIYIGDFHSRKIVVYDMSGRVAFVLDKLGRGFGEYLELKSFAVDSNNIYTIDNFTGMANIYDCRTGEFRTSKKLPVVAWDIETLGNGDFILAFIPVAPGKLYKSQPNYRIFITDNDFVIKRCLFKFDEDYSEPIGQPVFFTQSGDSIVFSSFQFDGFTVFDRNDAEQFYHVAIDFDHKIPEKHRRDKDIISNSRYSYLISTPVLCKDYVSIDICVGDYLENYVYDAGTGTFIGNPETDRKNYLIPPLCSFNGKFVSLLPGHMYAELIEKGFPRPASDIDRRLREGDSALLFYTL